MAAKDWAPLVISTLALAVSGTVAYRTSIRESYDLQAIVRSNVPGYTFGEDGSLNVNLAPDLLIVNNGNRPIGVTRIVLWTHQVSRFGPGCDVDGLEETPGIGLHPQPDTFEPSVVAAYEMKVLRPAFVTAGPEPEGNQHVAIVVPVRPARGLRRVQTCLEIEISVPNEGVRTNRSVLYYHVGDETGSTEGSLTAYAEGRPIILIDEARARFW